MATIQKKKKILGTWRKRQMTRIKKKTKLKSRNEPISAPNNGDFVMDFKITK